ncbi:MULTISPECIES: GvpL/GvpF family gas vesicle protein [unclassified Streptomyces]|uniref:GvpL/GvpF family gas vesicle protein n=1 Tax=unclassified Streptomyces TaxID=2593676 RepID=UPI002E335204|nr:GvpL/GvpF family gas vesicle protein [Streptomyces sp. NBC_01268]
MAVYVYAVTSRDHPCRVDGLTGVGSTGAEVRVVSTDGLRAVVSDIDEEIRPKRRDVAAHQAVQERLLSDGTPLPLRFGYTAPDDAAVLRALDENADSYRATLTRVDGCAEYQVKASRGQDLLLREILDDLPEARRLNREIVGGSADPRLPLELGRLVAAEVERRRAHAAEGLMRSLAPLGREHVVHPAQGDDFLALSLLVRQDDEEVSKALDERVRSGDDGVEFRLSGPLPPYSFVS